MASNPDSGHAERPGHECFETPEGTYCTKCASYYRDMGECLNCHGLECRRGPQGATAPVY